MDLFQLGQSARRLATATVGRDWLAMLREAGAGYQAVEEFIADWQSDQPMPVGAPSPDVLDEPLTELQAAVAGCESESESPAPVGAAPVGIDPATILLIIQAVKTFAELLAEIRRRRREQNG